MPSLDPRALVADFDALRGAERVRRAAAATGGEIYLVGGAVRDLALRRAVTDLDLVVVGDPAPLARALAGEAGHVAVHDRFGTATVRADDGARYDLATARRERYRVPGALPEVEPASLDDDLARRDFTVNALALGLAGPRRDQLLGVRDAEADLAARRLRVMHVASFAEDPTRLLRLARYAGRLGFAIELQTEALARAAVAEGALQTVSGDRIGAELWLLACEPTPGPGFSVLRAHGLDSAIAAGFGVADPTLLKRALALLDFEGAGGPDRAAHVVLAAALLEVPEPARRPLLDGLGLTRPARRAVLHAAAHAPALATRVTADGPPSRLLAVLPLDAPETVALAGGLGDRATARALAGWLGDHASIRLDIDGRDLIAAGLSPGPRIAIALRAALGAKLDGEAPSRERQLAIALRAVEADPDGG